MRRIRLTPIAKVLIFLVVLAGVGFGVYKSGALSDVFNGDKSSPVTYDQAGKIEQVDGVMNISLDEWVGWKPLLDANGGLTTQKGSINDTLGIKVNYSVINDATQSSNALIANKLNGAGYTVNRFAFLYPKFATGNTPVKMIYITNSSTGGDGIIAKKEINRIEDLVGKTIGVPRYSEAQTLIEWLLAKSNLTSDQVKDIRKNMKMFDTPDDAAKAFFSGELDVAATWQPYLSQATETVGAKVLFSTKNATNIILDGLVFRQDYLESHKNQVSKFVQGALMAETLYKTETKAIKNTFPMFSTSSDKDVIGMTDDATLTNCKSNIEVLKQGGTARTLFVDMSNIWKSIGEQADSTVANTVFDESIVSGLISNFPEDKVQTIKFNDTQKTEAQKQDNNTALLSKKLRINFDENSTSISPDSFSTLQDFANIAKILNGTVIQIEGNTDNQGSSANDISLSTERAKSIARYLQAQGVDSSRLITIGNGATKPINPANTPEAYAQNRRTDAYFKVVN